MNRNQCAITESEVVKIERPVSLELTMKLNTNDVSEIIDLRTPEIHLGQSSPLAIVEATEPCPRLRSRLPILALYPISLDQDEIYARPLLVNRAPHRLTHDQLALRSTNFSEFTLEIIDHDPAIPSFLRDKYRQFYKDLVQRLKVDMPLLDFNYTRLNQYIRMLSNQQIRIFHFRPEEIEWIHEKEYPLALEFYLQFDLDVFYMKTCAFRGARPRTMSEGLFCVKEPEARYDLSECGNCGLCYPRQERNVPRRKSAVKYSQAHQYQCLSGYRIILNCSVSCHTENIIYVLRCPCDRFEYIGSTTYSLDVRLKQHRQHGNRIMHEFLLGQENIKREVLRPKSKEVLRKDRMKLYQHSARCSIAWKRFLRANPEHWPFVPMPLEKAEQVEEKQVQPLVLGDHFDWHHRSKLQCDQCLTSVPTPPKGYVFSNRQHRQQTEFFHLKRDLKVPDMKINLYEASIIAVLPDQCSDAFRYLIESMFITHADTNLNTIGNVLKLDQRGDQYPLDDPWLFRVDRWCEGLHH